MTYTIFPSSYSRTLFLASASFQLSDLVIAWRLQIPFSFRQLACMCSAEMLFLILFIWILQLWSIFKEEGHPNPFILPPCMFTQDGVSRNMLHLLPQTEWAMGLRVKSTSLSFLSNLTSPSFLRTCFFAICTKALYSSLTFWLLLRSCINKHLKK